MLQPFLWDLTNFLLIRSQGGGSFLQVLVVTAQFGTLPALSLDLLGILLVLGISIIGAFLVSLLNGGQPPSTSSGRFCGRCWGLVSLSYWYRSSGLETCWSMGCPCSPRWSALSSSSWSVNCCSVASAAAGQRKPPNKGGRPAPTSACVSQKDLIETGREHLPPVS